MTIMAGGARRDGSRVEADVMFQMNERTSLVASTGGTTTTAIGQERDGSRGGFLRSHRSSRRSSRHHQSRHFGHTLFHATELVKIPDLVRRDKPSEMTYSRRIARYLSTFSWYHPTSGNFGRDSSPLHAGWWYYEHYTLPRYVGVRHGNQQEQFRQNPSADGSSSDNVDGTGQNLMVSAARGDHTTETYLYPVLSTAETDLADFGDDIGIYFFTLRMLSIIFFVAGLMSMPNILFFACTEWDPLQKYTERWRLLETSAVCTDHSWRACPTCDRKDWDTFPATFDRYAEATTENGETLTFILTNSCNITGRAGMVACITMVFVWVAVYLMGKAADRRERRLDESKQTTKDYSIQVKNPPSDTDDPDEWKRYFSQFGPVVSVTIVKNNEVLIRQLSERRKLIGQLEDLMPSGITVDPANVQEAYKHALPVSLFWKFLGTKDGHTIQKKIQAIDNLIINDLSKRPYGVAEVFAIFENEADQQRCLDELQIPLYQIHRKNLAALDKPEHAFRRNHILYVEDPPEPSNVNWNHLGVTVGDYLRQRTITYFITLFLLCFCCAFVVYVKVYYGSIYAAFAVSGVTSVAPTVCNYLISFGETHHTEESRQISLFCKITAFLWIIATLLTARITPFTRTLDNDALIPAMYAIFVTEMLKTPFIQILDVPGNFKKHVLAPRSPSLKKAAKLFRGTQYELSERYTNMTKVLFMTFYYSMIFPAAYFLAGATLVVHYWVDKFCLLRLWAPAPELGGSIGKVSRNYFFKLACMFYVMKSAYNYASFPFDDACELPQTVPTTYVGTFIGTDGRGEQVAITIPANDQMYKYCCQDLANYRYFPPVLFATPTNQPPGEEWMSETQHFASIFGVASFWLMVFTLASLGNHVRKHVQILFWRPPTSRLRNKNIESPASSITFHQIMDECSGYVPSIILDTEPFPLLVCNAQHLPAKIMSWSDPQNPDYRVHCALNDIPGLSDRPIFSTVHYWPPNIMADGSNKECNGVYLN